MNETCQEEQRDHRAGFHGALGVASTATSISMATMQHGAFWEVLSICPAVQMIDVNDFGNRKSTFRSAVVVGHFRVVRECSMEI